MADANIAPDAPTTPTTAAPSEATPSTTLNEAPQAAPAPAPDPFDTWVNANGGREKVLEKMKMAIGDPVGYARKVLEQQQPQPQVQALEPQVAQPAQPVQPQVEQGFMSPFEFAVRQYGDSLSKEYSELGEYVSKAQYMDDMSKMGIKTVDQYGNINDNAIRQFLDLKKQAAAANAPVAPVTATPTVEYYNVPNDQVTTKDDAMAILAQNAQLRGSGNAEHPMTNQAKEYLQRYFKENH